MSRKLLEKHDMVEMTKFDERWDVVHRHGEGILPAPDELLSCIDSWVIEDIDTGRKAL
jgi:hypothetical protein